MFVNITCSFFQISEMTEEIKMKIVHIDLYWNKFKTNSALVAFCNNSDYICRKYEDLIKQVIVHVNLLQIKSNLSSDDEKKKVTYVTYDQETHSLNRMLNNAGQKYQIYICSSTFKPLVVNK